MNINIDIADKKIRTIIIYGGLLIAVIIPLIAVNVYIANEARSVTKEISEAMKSNEAAAALLASLEAKQKENQYLTKELEQLTDGAMSYSFEEALLEFNYLAAANNIKVKKFVQEQSDDIINLPYVRQYAFSVTVNGSLTDIIRTLKDFEITGSKITSIELNPEDGVAYHLIQPQNGDMVEASPAGVSQMTLTMVYTGKGEPPGAEI